MNRIPAATLSLVTLAALICTAWWLTPGSSPNATLSESTAHLVWVIEDSVDRSHLARPGNSGFESLPAELVHPLSLRNTELTEGERVNIPLPGDNSFDVEIRGSIRHDNGDLTIHVSGEDRMSSRAVMTFGRTGTFARVTTPDGLFLVHSDATGTWLIDLNDERIDVDNFHGDTLGHNSFHPITEAVVDARTAGEDIELHGIESTQSASPVQIDVMFIYTPDMLERYPGGLIDTRLNHLVAIANQAMVDSEVDIVVRVVHHRSVNYTRHQENREALQDLARAMQGTHVPGLGGVRRDRQDYGADIVALTWPHNIETRGACGIAYFPRTDSQGDPDPAFGVHIDNDGASNWSVCSDAVFTHELGHNLGAEHQRSQASVDDPEAHNYAFVRDQRFHTVMGSFGTGDVNRYLRLDVFSTPEIQCGGEPCGSMTHGEGANNARKISELAPVVAGYADRQISGVASRPDPSEPDSDGDGVSDWEDPFPFDPFDGQTPPVTSPPLVFSDRPQRDGSSSEDWELLVISSGNDRVLSYDTEGRFLGIVAAPEAVDAGPVLTEYSDMDVDDRGLLYLLASGDVRRFDRLSGRLVDVFLSSQRPEPAELQSAFPRAMGWLSNDQLLVLGADVVERYNINGTQMNGRGGGNNPQKDPDSWNRVVDLPLRAFAEHDGQVYVADAEFNRIMTFDLVTGWRADDVAAPGNRDIVDPWNLAFGPDGLLYLANGKAGNVLRFDVTTGNLVDEFIPRAAGGLEFARALAFGPDGDLYVACRLSNRVLRFDGGSGQFVETVASAEHGDLDSPESLLFATRVNQIHAGHSGHYFVPERSGEGWLLEILDEQQAALSWFTYPAAGTDSAEQAWALGVGDITGNQIVFDDVLATRLLDPALGYTEDNLQLIEWGSMVFEFNHCNHGFVEYDSSLKGSSGRLDFSRLGNIEGLPCGSVALAPADSAPGISGQWYDRSTNGQGWFFQEVGPQRVFTAWFTYDADGEQAWVVGEGRLEGRELVFENLIMTRGARFGEDFASDDIEHIDWGSMQVYFSACDLAEVEFDSVLPNFGSGTYNAERLTELHGLECGFSDQ
jgi:WD40 repeat protein